MPTKRHNHNVEEIKIIINACTYIMYTTRARQCYNQIYRDDMGTQGLWLDEGPVAIGNEKQAVILCSVT